MSEETLAALRAAVLKLGRVAHEAGACHATYAPLPLEGIVVARPDSPKRWATIRDGSPNLKDKTFLDLGCATGYFCLEAAKQGAEVTGLDHDPPQIDVARLLFAHEGREGQFHVGREGTVYNRKFDVALALNVLHHIGRERAKVFLAWAGENVDLLWLEMPADDPEWLLPLCKGFTDVRWAGDFYCEGSHRPQRVLYRLGHDEPFTLGKQVIPTSNSQALIFRRPATGLFPERAYWLNVHPHERVLEGWRLCKERLGSPHFPKVYELGLMPEGPYRGTPFVAMEWVEGTPPQKWRKKDAQAIVKQLAEASIAHRDLRTRNILVRPTGEWCLLDFGWACATDDPYPHGGAMLQDDAYGYGNVKGELGG